MLPVKQRSMTLTACFALAAAACSESTSVEGDTHLRVLLTDAAAEYIETASVDIGAVEILPADNGAPIPLSEDGTDGLQNLFELQDAATMVLGEATFDAGAYEQIRMIVEAAHVTLKEGYEFTDGSTEKALEVPSGAQTGIKLILSAAEPDEDGPLILAPGEQEIVLDFDVSQSFLIQGNPETPAGIHGMLFKPTIRVSLPSAAGTITGTVSTALEDVSVEGLTVAAERVEDEEGEEVGEGQTETATGKTKADGTYELHYIVPGTYIVTVGVGEGLTTEPESVEVEVGATETVADVNFEVVTSG